MKSIDMKKIGQAIAADFDAIVEIVGEYGDCAWEDADIEEIMQKHDLNGYEAVQLLKDMSSAMRHINAIAVRAADKGASEALSGIDADERDMGAMHTDIWHGTSEAVRKSMIETMKRDPVAFITMLRK